MKAGGIFGGALEGVPGGGLFGKGQVSGLGYAASWEGGECVDSIVSACKTSCATVEARGGNEEQCVAACCIVGGPAKALACENTCKQYRADTPESAQCYQKCHGYTPVDYSSEKSACEKQGMVFSWLEGGCVNKAKFESCPAGTYYVKYPDGSEKCVGQGSVASDKCPPGTTLQKVPGGSTCVSPVKPSSTPPKTTTPVRTTPGTTTQIQPSAPPASTSMLKNPLVWAGAAAVAIAGFMLLGGEKKPAGKPGTAKGSMRPATARANRRGRKHRRAR